MPPVDRKPGQPEVYYFDDTTRDAVLAKRRTPAAPAKATKRTAKATKKK